MSELGSASLNPETRDGIAMVLTIATLAAVAHGSGLLATDAIKSALDKGAVAPTNSPVITSLLTSIQGNWYWFLLGTLPLALSVLLGAVALGVRSASDWLFRLLLGIVGIIAFAPAIVA